MTTTLTNPLVIYHGGCRDGWCAAWVLHTLVGDKATYHAAYYGKEPPDVRGRHVVIVDFSYPRDVMVRIANDCLSLLVLDHHKTAAAALDGFEDEMRDVYGTDVTVVFDMERSGAGLAWDFLFPGQPRPWLVNYVEDRDLWRHALPDSRDINAYIGILPFDFSEWDDEAHADFRRSLSITFGKQIRRKVAQYIAEASGNVRWARVCGTLVPVVNAPQVDISELLDAILSDTSGRIVDACYFAVGWWQRFDGKFQFSLRSRGDFDVSELAKTFGGGGHKNAAGFQLDTLPSFVTGKA